MQKDLLPMKNVNLNDRRYLSCSQRGLKKVIECFPSDKVIELSVGN